VTYDRARRFAHVQYLDGALETPEDVAQLRAEIEEQMRPLPVPVDVVVDFGALVVKPAVAAAYDEARRAMFERLARRAYRYHGSQLVRTKVLTSSTLHGQRANLYATFEEAVKALEDDRARGR
jgi:hypothetical protein